MYTGTTIIYLYYINIHYNNCYSHYNAATTSNYNTATTTTHALPILTTTNNYYTATTTNY